MNPDVKELESQAIEIGKKLSTHERTQMFNLLRRYARTQPQDVARIFIARELRDTYGFDYDEKDYGADQNVEKGEHDY